MRARVAAAAGASLAAGAVCCLLAFFFLGAAFKQGDCDGGCNAGAIAGGSLSLLLAFPVVGVLVWWRSGRTWRGLALILAALSALILLPTGGLYVQHLYKTNETLQADRDVRSNQDDSYMLLAVRDVSTLGVRAGQRCVFSKIDCEQNPRRIEASCKHGAIQILEVDWQAFIRLPAEDFPIPPDATVQRFPHSCQP